MTQILQDIGGQDFVEQLTVFRQFIVVNKMQLNSLLDLNPVYGREKGVGCQFL